MAISKDQPLRPYVQELGAAFDAAVNLEPRVAEIEREIGDGFTDTTITNVFGALSSAVQGISDELGSGFTNESTVTDAVDEIGIAITALQGWQNRFRIGLTESLTVEMGDSVSSTLAFNTPLPYDSEVAVFLVCVDGSEILTGLSCTLISATYSGFSYAVANDTEADVTIKVGFLAVRMN